MRATWVMVMISGCVAGASARPILPTAAMGEVRATHSATLLGDGRVLIAGGFMKGPDGYRQIYSRTAELYDPRTREFGPAGRMVEARAGHIATRLDDGRVLIAGGFDAGGVMRSAEIYDPETARFTPTGPMGTARGGFTATLLGDGRVLVAGGGDVRATATAEVWDPATGRFAPTGSMHSARLGHTATRLDDGSVLVAGGAADRGVILDSAERYDPATGRFTAAAHPIAARYKHEAILLRDGKVLIAGGSDARDWKGQMSSAELYDPAADRFTAVGPMRGERFKLRGAMVLLPDGRVLIAGGNAELEVFDPRSRRFAPAGSLDAAYYYGTATLLPDGTVLVAGGYDRRAQATARAWVVAAMR